MAIQFPAGSLKQADLVAPFSEIPISLAPITGWNSTPLLLKSDIDDRRTLNWFIFYLD